MTVPAPTTQLVHLRHDQLVPATDNVRTHVGDVSELANSIAQAGVLQPLRVSMPEGAKKATIVAGARRHAAIAELIADGRWRKNQLIPCVFDGELDDEQRVVAMLIENLQRADLDPIEEATGYQRLIDDFGYTRERIRTATGRSKTAVQVRLALLKLAPEVQSAVAARSLPLDIASRLAALPKIEQEKVVARKGPDGITPWMIEEAEKAIEREQLTNRFFTTCQERGVVATSQPAAVLARTHTATLSMPAKDFASALLPDDLSGAYARLDHYTKSVEIWLPIGDRPEAFTDDALTAWRAECDRIRAEHARAEAAWKARRIEQLAVFARKAPAKLVHEAAMIDALDARDDRARMAELAGFTPPSVADLDDQQALDLVDKWLEQPANLVATTAVALLEHPAPGTGLAAAFGQHLAAELGDKPTMPDLPPHPAATQNHVDQIDDAGDLDGHELPAD